MKLFTRGNIITALSLISLSFFMAGCSTSSIGGLKTVRTREQLPPVKRYSVEHVNRAKTQPVYTHINSIKKTEPYTKVIAHPANNHRCTTAAIKSIAHKTAAIKRHATTAYLKNIPHYSVGEKTFKLKPKDEITLYFALAILFGVLAVFYMFFIIPAILFLFLAFYHLYTTPIDTPPTEHRQKKRREKPKVEGDWYELNQEKVALYLLLASVLLPVLAVVLHALSLQLILIAFILLIASLIVASNAKHRLEREKAPEERISFANTIRLIDLTIICTLILFVVLYIIAVIALIIFILALI